MKTVYLAGPITGATTKEANDWRNEFRAKLQAYGISGISPLRCEPPGIGGKYEGIYDDPKFGTAKAISSKNMMDLQTCDITLCYFPPGAPLSVGTLAELFIGWAWRRPVIVVSHDPKLVNHPLVQMAAGWILPDLDEAFELITGLFDGYM